MRDIGEGTIRRIDWQELTPVVLLLRVFNVATGFRVLVLAMLGTLLTVAIGFWMNGLVSAGRGDVVTLIDEGGRFIEENPRRNDRLYAQPNDLRSILDLKVENPVAFRHDPSKYLLQQAERSVLAPWDFFSTVGSRFLAHDWIFSKKRGAEDLRLLKNFGISFAGFIAVLTVWVFFGGMICRTVALRLTIDQAESSSESWCFMTQRGTGFFSSMLIVVTGILVCLIPIKIAAFCFSWPILNVLTAILFPLVLLSAFFAVVLAFGLLAGWPLLFAAIATEGTDGFDAVSRMFSYVYQRLFHYFFYWTVSAVFGLIGFLVVSFFADNIVFLTIAFDGFPETAAISSIAALTRPETTANLAFPETLVLCWCAMVQLMKTSFAFAWFWTSAVAIYILLRRSVDATPLLDVYRQGAAAEKPMPMPEITLDEKGAPEIVAAPAE